MSESFDAPDGIRTCSRREASNTAPQSLTLLNGKWTVEEASRLGSAISKDNKAPADVAKSAWRAVLARDPDAAELERTTKFLEAQTAELGTPMAAASELARALFNTNEFLYVD